MSKPKRWQVWITHNDGRMELVFSSKDDLPAKEYALLKAPRNVKEIGIYDTSKVTAPCAAS